MEEIAVRILKSGMLSNLDEEEIKRKIQMFLRPEKSKIHERPIRIRDAVECELKVEARNLKDELWNIVYELGLRLDYFVSRDGIAKCIESAEISWYALVDDEDEQGE